MPTKNTASWARCKSALIASLPARKVSRERNSLLFATLQYAGGEARRIFFHNLWHHLSTPDPELEIKIVSQVFRGGRWQATIRVWAKRLARYVSFYVPNDPHVHFDDNFFDLMPGERKTIAVEANRRLRPADIEVHHWGTVWP